MKAYTISQARPDLLWDERADAEDVLGAVFAVAMSQKAAKRMVESVVLEEAMDMYDAEEDETKEDAIARMCAEGEWEETYYVHPLADGTDHTVLYWQRSWESIDLTLQVREFEMLEEEG